MTTMAEMQKVVDECFIDIYVATYMVKMNYPLRLEAVNDSSPTVAEKAESYMLDWGISDNADAGNEDVLDRGEYLGADIVVPRDEVDDVDGTLEQFEEFLLLYDEHEYDGDFLIPTQSEGETTHAQCLGLVEDLCQDYGYSTDRTVAIGGIKDTGIIEKAEACNACEQWPALCGVRHSDGVQRSGYASRPSLVDVGVSDRRVQCNGDELLHERSSTGVGRRSNDLRRRAQSSRRRAQKMERYE